MEENEETEKVEEEEGNDASAEILQKRSKRQLSAS